MRSVLKDHPKMVVHAGKAQFRSWPPSSWAWSGGGGLPDHRKATLEAARIVPVSNGAQERELFVDIIEGTRQFSSMVALDPDPEFRDYLCDILEQNIGKTVKEIGGIVIHWPEAAEE